MSALVEQGGVAFDYAALTDNVATAAREAASRIRERVRGQQIAIFDIGRDLIAMKDALGHGHFLAWIGAEFGMNERTARRFMNVADVLGAKSDTVSDLPPTVLYALAAPSTPVEIREEVIGAIEAGEPPAPDRVRERIRAAREVERERRAEAKLTPGQRKHRRKVARSAEQEERERQKRVAEREANISQAIEMIRSRLGDKFPELVALVKKVDSWYFLDALTKALDPA